MHSWLRQGAEYEYVLSSETVNLTFEQHRRSSYVLHCMAGCFRPEPVVRLSLLLTRGYPRLCITVADKARCDFVREVKLCDGFAFSGKTRLLRLCGAEGTGQKQAH